MYRVKQIYILHSIKFSHYKSEIFYAMMNRQRGCINCDCLSKTRHICTQKLKFIIYPQFMATLNNYACSLPPLADVHWSAFRPCESMTGEMVPKESSKLAAVTWYGSHCLSRPCSGILVLCGYIHVHIIATLDFIICVIFLLCLSFFHHPPYPCASPANSFIYAGPVLMNFIKKSSKMDEN